MTLNASIPRFDCFVRDAFLYGLDEEAKGLTRGVCHAVTSLAGRALGFHCLLENGAHISRLPIHAIVTKEDAPPVPLNQPWLLQLWNCFSYELAVTEFDYLSGMRVRAALADRSQHGGEYLFTIDYYGAQEAEAAGENGWKCHHLIELDNGWLAALPNNRLAWFDPAFTDTFTEPPKYATMPCTWSVEDGSKWRSGGGMFYDVMTGEA